jgi:hypothetical protein
MMAFVWLMLGSAALFFVGWSLFAVADALERSRFGVPLSAERGEQVGNRVGGALAAIVFFVVVLWFEVGSQVFTAVVAAGLAYMFCYAPIAGSAKGRAGRKTK